VAACGYGQLAVRMQRPKPGVGANHVQLGDDPGVERTRSVVRSHGRRRGRDRDRTTCERDAKQGRPPPLHLTIVG
jgi:hypothetical protein